MFCTLLCIFTNNIHVIVKNSSAKGTCFQYVKRQQTQLTITKSCLQLPLDISNPAKVGHTKHILIHGLRGDEVDLVLVDPAPYGHGQYGDARVLCLSGGVYGGLKVVGAAVSEEDGYVRTVWAVTSISSK